MSITMLAEHEAKANIAANVRQLMESRALTQEALASEANVSQGFVSKILRAAILPNALLLHNIAEALGVTSDKLLDFPRRKAS
jgi:transcriptional regulator with XRE-family HTH domain